MGKASLLAVAALAMPAGAQESDPQRSSPGAESSPDTRPADDIIVTGRYSSYAKPVADTALKVPIPLKDLPQAASIITSDFIRDIHARDLNDVVPFIAGASQSLSSFLGAGGIILRGQQLDSNNGYKLDGGQFSDFGSIDNAIVDSVEILKGPVASLYGRGPGVGVVNYLTKRPTDGFSVQTELEAGTYDHLRGVIDVDLPLAEGIGSRVVGYASNDDNDVNSGNVRVLGLYGTIEAGLSATTRVRITDSFKNFRNGKGTYRFATLDAEENIVPPFFIRRDAPNGASNDLYRYTDNLLTGRIDRNLGDDTSLLIRASYDDFNRRTQFSTVSPLDPLVEGDPVVIDDIAGGNVQKRRITSATIESNLVRRLTSGSLAGSSFLLGASYDRTDAEASFGPVTFANAGQTVVLGRDGIDFGRSTQSGPLTPRSDMRATGKGVFGQVVLKHDRLTLLGSGRYDGYVADDRRAASRDREEQFSYRAGASYGLTGQLDVFLGYGTGFNPTSALGLTKFLEPETDKNIEAGVKFSGNGGRLNVSVTAFRTRKTHVAIALPPPDDSFSVDLGSQIFKGIEADTQLSPLRGLDLVGAFTLLDGTLEDGSRPTAVPKVAASGFARYGLANAGLREFNVSGGVSYVGRAPLNTPAGDFGGLGRVGYAPGYALLRAGIGYTGLKAAEFNLFASNLLNKRYFIGNGFATFFVQEGDPRSVILSVRSRF